MPKKTERNNSGLAAVVAISILVYFAWAIMRPAKEVENRESAIAACRSFIKHRLDDPDAAEFEAPSMATARKRDGVWFVVRKARVKNIFNATMLAEYECLVKFNGENWNAISVTQIR